MSGWGAYDPAGYRLEWQICEDLFPDHDQFGEPWMENEHAWEPITRLHRVDLCFSEVPQLQNVRAGRGDGDRPDPARTERQPEARTLLPSRVTAAAHLHDVTGGAGGHEPPAPTGARAPDRSQNAHVLPLGESRPAPQVSDVVEPGGSRAGLQ